jgi:hypothetical protein
MSMIAARSANPVIRRLVVAVAWTRGTPAGARAPLDERGEPGEVRQVRSSV